MNQGDRMRSCQNRPVKWALIFLFLLAGCTTYVHQTNRNTSYKEKIREASIAWIPNPAALVQISQVRGISSKNEKDAVNSTQELLKLFGDKSVLIVARAMSGAGVRVIFDENPSSIRIKMKPDRAQSECTQLGCQHSLWIDVQIFDGRSSQFVWAGSFKVGAPFLAKNDETVIDNFSETLIGELKRAQLL